MGNGGRGPGSGWILREITVRESPEAEEKYVF